MICIVVPRKDVYSETFIRAHIEHLPTKIKILYGRPFPSHQNDGTPLLPADSISRFKRRLSQTALKLPDHYFREESLRHFFRKNNVQAVLAEYGPTGVAIMEVCKKASIPLIVHFHGYDAYKYALLERMGSFYRELFENAAAIISVSRDMEQQLLQLGAPREKLYYNPYGVDVSLFQGANPSVSLPSFLSVGRFVDKKAPHLTLLAFEKVLKKYPDAKLVMIGDGWLKEACMQMSNALGIANAVEFPGLLSHSEVAAAMQRARAFVQHSIKSSQGDSEGTPVAVLEAGAAGLPVVATRHGGIRDVIIDEKTGFLVQERDIDGMADRMLRLALDPSLAARIGSAARQRICAEFKMEKSIRNLWSIIEEAIRTPTAGRIVP